MMESARKCNQEALSDYCTGNSVEQCHSLDMIYQVLGEALSWFCC
jgi:hypothetical protein